MSNKAAQEDGKRDIRMRLVVAARALDYIGATPCDFIAEGAELLQYNILAKSHRQYKSTVSYMHKGGVS